MGATNGRPGEMVMMMMMMKTVYLESFSIISKDWKLNNFYGSKSHEFVFFKKPNVSGTLN